MLTLTYLLTALASLTLAVSGTTTGAIFTIPDGKQAVNVKLINAANATGANAYFFRSDPDVPVVPLQNLATYAFLLEHPKNGRRVMFDIGIRKDLKSLAPALYAAYADANGNFPFTVLKDVPTQLTEGGISLDSIDTVIWSHSHFDHIGDPTRLSNKTSILAGPGTLSNISPGYPADKNAQNLASDFQSRRFSEVKYDGPRIAGQKSHDFFGDGSVYLIDTPGHIAGHMAALVRVTVNPSTFVLLAGDAGHHVALIRPSPDIPLPTSVVQQLPAALKKYGTPDFKDPFVHANPQNMSVDQDAVADQITMNALRRFDARTDVWVLLAHDASLKLAKNGTKYDPSAIPVFPGATINDWASKGWKDSSRFSFLNPTNPANIFSNGSLV